MVPVLEHFIPIVTVLDAAPLYSNLAVPFTVAPDLVVERDTHFQPLM